MKKKNDHGAELAAAGNDTGLSTTVPASGGLLTPRILIELLSRVKDPKNLDKPLRFLLTEGGKPERESRSWFSLTLIGNNDHRVVFLQSEKDPLIIGGGDRDEVVMFLSLNEALDVVAKPSNDQITRSPHSPASSQTIEEERSQ